MLAFIAQRIGKAVIVLLAIVVLNFFLIRMAPGDPALVMAGEAGAGDQIFVAQLRDKFGLDKPLPVQLYLYVEGHRQPRSRLFLSPADAGRETDPGPASGHAAADRNGVCDFAGVRRPVRNAGGAPGRQLDGYRHHGIGADLLRHAAVLGRADGDPAVLGHDGLAAELWLRDGRRQLHRARPCAGCRRPSDHAGHDDRPVLHGDLCPHDARLDARGQAARLRQDRPRQGLARCRDPAPPRAAQRAAAGRDARGPAGRHAGRRRGADRNRVRLARHRPPDVRSAVAARLQPAARRLRGVFGDGAGYSTSSPI